MNKVNLEQVLGRTQNHLPACSVEQRLRKTYILPELSKLPATEERVEDAARFSRSETQPRNASPDKLANGKIDAWKKQSACATYRKRTRGLQYVRLLSLNLWSATGDGEESITEDIL
jgi:hypothetical protein